MAQQKSSRRGNRQAPGRVRTAPGAVRGRDAVKVAAAGAAGSAAWRRPIVLTPGLALLALVVITLVAYANAWPNSMTFDDRIFADSERFAGIGWSDLGRFFTEDLWAATGVDSGLYRPLMLVLIAVQAWLFGDWLAGYHLVNILLHALVTVAAFGLVAHVLRASGSEPETARLVALLAAIVFGVHPIHTEVVNSIFNGSEMLVSLGIAGGLWWFLRTREHAEIRAWLGLGVIYLLVLLCRESAASLPALAVALLWLTDRDRWTMRLRKSLPVVWLLVPLLIYLALRTHALEPPPTPTGATAGRPDIVSVPDLSQLEAPPAEPAMDDAEAQPTAGAAGDGAPVGVEIEAAADAAPAQMVAEPAGDDPTVLVSAAPMDEPMAQAAGTMPESANATSAEAPDQSASQPAIEAGLELGTQTAAETELEPEAQSAAGTAAEAGGQPAGEPTLQPAGEPLPQPVVVPAPEPAAELASEPAADTATAAAPAAEPAPEPAGQLPGDPATSAPPAEPVTDPVPPADQERWWAPRNLQDYWIAFRPGRLLPAAGMWLESYRIMLWPYPLQIYYDRPDTNQWVAAALQIALLGLALLAYLKQRPGLLVGLAFFYLSILPSSQVFGPVSAAPGLADRILYLPSVGLTMALAAGLWWLVRRFGPRVAVVAVAVVTLVLVPLTWARNAEWINDVVLAESTYQRLEDKDIILNTLIAAHLREGSLQRAVDLCEMHGEGWPPGQSWGAHCGTAYGRSGRLAEAEEAYLSATHHYDSVVFAHINLAMLYLHLGRRAEAITQFNYAILREEVPFRQAYFSALMLIQMFPGDRDRLLEARAHLERALALQPQHAESRAELASLNARLGQ